MNNKHNRRHAAGAIAFLLGLLLWSTASAAAPPDLFMTAPESIPRDALVVRDREVVRARKVVLNKQLLATAFGESNGGSQALTFNLFDGVAYIAEPLSVVAHGRGTTWIGQLRGVENSTVTIVTQGETASGNVALPGARYHIRYIGNGLHEIQEIDTSLFQPENRPIVPESPNFPGRESSPSPDSSGASDDGSTIDVMVVYTATTRAASGGTSSILGLIDLAIAETNQSYAHSGIMQRIRLVHTEEVSYAETGRLETDLTCIADPADACLDSVHALRDSYGADMVSLWVEDGDACGIGYLMTAVTDAFAPYAFSVVKKSCAAGNYSFSHELGHNMGAQHDIYVSSSNDPYVYAHGYTYSAAASPWRTIMAYNDACLALGKNCARVPFWSNPSVRYGGVPMGNASADNRQTLNNTALTVANFRLAAAPPPQQHLTVLKAGSGTVTSSPAGINCGAICSASFSGGTSVALIANPAPGATFNGWSGACSGTAATCAVTMNASASVTASFSISATASCPEIAVYRYHNTQTLGHFYSVDLFEGSALIGAGVPLQYDGVAFNGCSGGNAADGIYPVYRFRNLIQPGLYFYSMQPSEIASVRANLSNILSEEGIAYYAFDGPATGNYPVYRFRNNTVSGANFFTILDSEKAGIISSVPGYSYEGIGFYALPPH